VTPETSEKSFEEAIKSAPFEHGPDTGLIPGRTKVSAGYSK